MKSNTQSKPQLSIKNQFQIIEKIGAGAFGEVYRGINQKNKKEVAIKLEKSNTKNPQLFYEAKLYQYLLNSSQSNMRVKQELNVPQMYYAHVEGEYNIMIMDLLGPSLEDLFNFCGKRFSVKTTAMVAIQLIECMELIHSKDFLHRDIKPDNFLIGMAENVHKIYMIDLGLAKRYMVKGQHIPKKEGKNLTGTARYASINTHLGVEQARRDDLESIGHVLFYFLLGILPWQNQKGTNKKDKYTRIMEVKLQTPIETLNKNHPKEFAAFLQYARNLKFEEKPDYSYCKSLFNKILSDQKQKMDYEYDWVIKAKEKNIKISEIHSYMKQEKK